MNRTFHSSGTASDWRPITAILVVAAVLATVSATLVAPVGAIVLGEVSGLACLTAFTLLVWAAIQDGKQPDRTVVGAD